MLHRDFSLDRLDAFFDEGLGGNASRKTLRIITISREAANGNLRLGRAQNSARRVSSSGPKEGRIKQVAQVFGLSCLSVGRSPITYSLDIRCQHWPNDMSEVGEDWIQISCMLIAL